MTTSNQLPATNHVQFQLAYEILLRPLCSYILLSDLDLYRTLKLEKTSSRCYIRILKSSSACHSNPTPPDGDRGLLSVVWEPCSPGNVRYLNIEDSLEMRSGPLFPRQPFWEGLYQKYMGRMPLTANQPEA